MTKGESVIRPDFGNITRVKELKKKFAELYDEIVAIATWNDLNPANTESNRLTQIALDNLEVSAMFATKAMTV